MLEGQKVMHDRFGEGVVKVQQQNFLIVSFADGEKRLAYPQAFEMGLALCSPEFQGSISDDLRQATAQQQEQLRIQKEASRERLRTRREQELQGAGHVLRKSGNLALKCIYCDGGRTETVPGFCGICSDAVIRSNINGRKCRQCGAAQGPCRNRLEEKISRQQLDALYEQTENPCWESRLLKDWKALAYATEGGQQKRALRIRKNGLCILTTREPQATEKERQIFALFLAEEMSDDGVIAAGNRHRLILSPDEARRMLFWNYYGKVGKTAKRATWGSGLYRYFDDETATRILEDVVHLKRKTPEAQQAKEFYEFFIKYHRLRPGK